MKRNNLLKVLLLNILLIFSLLLSCEVGLGSSVDTEVPEIDIVSPPSDSIIRSSFAIKGNWSDDGGVDNVKVTLKNLDTKKEYGPFPAELSNIQEQEIGQKGNWLCSINPNDSNSPIPDGNYEATVIIEDKSKRTNKLNRNFSLDNTPPVVILERPGSKAENEAVMDVYGQIVTLQGMASDDHSVEKIEFQVYSDNEYKNLLKTIELKNVPPTINLELASFKAGETNAYYEMYGSATILPDSAQKRYCKIVSYDGSVSYPADGSEQKEEDKIGNKTEIYYLKDEISSAGILTDSCKITDIYHIFNGTKEADGNFIANLKAYEITNGVFKLNPKNNPTFAVSINEDKKLYEGSPLTIEVTAGLDGYGLILNTLRPYLIDISTGDKIYIENPITNGGVQSTYKWNSIITSAKGVVNGKTYRIGVDGTDEVVGNLIEPAAGPYEFTFDTKAYVKVEVSGVMVNGTNIVSENLYYVPKFKPGVSPDTDSVFTVEGSLITTAGNGLVDILIDDKRKGGITITENEKDPSYNDSDNLGKIKYDFIKTFTTSDFNIADGEHTLKVKGLNGEAENVFQKQIIIDSKGPTFKSFDVEPVANKYSDNTESGNIGTNYLNGTVKISLDIIDECSQIDTVKTKLQKSSDGINYSDITETTELSFDFDTPTVADDKKLKIIVTATDKAGNISSKEKIFTIDQDTDLPVIQPASPSETTLLFKKEADLKNQKASDEGKKKNYIDVGNMLSLKAYDDDGIDTINAKFFDKNNIKVSEEDKNGGKNKELPFDLTVPGTAGIYRVELTIKDINKDNKKRTKSYPPFYIRVVSAKPDVSLNKKGVNHVKTGADTDKLDIEVFINSDSPAFKLQRKLKNKDGEEITEYFEEFTKDSAGFENLGNDAPTVTDSITLNKTVELPSGKYTLVYVATDGDGNGNSSEESTIDVYVDNEKPSVEFTSEELTSEASEAGSYKFAGTATDNADEFQSGIDKIEYEVTSIKTNAVIASGIAGGSKEAWNTTLSFNTWAEGNYKITVIAKDKVGNISESKSQTFWYDKSAPNASIEYFNIKDAEHKFLQGEEDNRTFYYNNSVKLFGKAKDTNGIKSAKLIQKHTGEIDKEIPVTPSLDSGEWEVSDLPKVDEGKTASGTYEYKLVVEDISGKKVETLTQTLGVDKTAPTVTISSPGNKSILSGNKFTFTATPNDTSDSISVASGVVSLTYSIFTKAEDGTLTPYGTNSSITMDAESGKAVTETKLIGTGRDESNKTVDLLEGHYVIKVTAKDKAGNVTTTPKEVEFYVDQTDPTLTVNPVSPVGLNKIKSGESDVTITVTGTITETNELASLVAYRSDDTDKKKPINITTVSKQPNNETWTFEDKIAKSTKDEKYTYEITAKDIAGNPANVSCDVIVDTIAPVVDAEKITGPSKEETEYKSFRFEGQDGCITDDSPYYELDKVQGKFADLKPGANITPDFTATTGSKDGIWSYTVTFEKYEYFNSEGNKKLWIRAFDKAGNSSEWVNKDFVYDTAAPIIDETTINSDGKYQNANFTLGGTLKDNYGINSITLKANTTDLTVTHDPENKTWKADVAKGILSDGKYSIVATATDNSGKVTSVTRNVIVDTLPPNIIQNGITSTTSIAENKKVIGEDTWYKTRTIQLSVEAKDETSGIKSVAYSTDRSGWSELTKQSDGETFKGAVTFDSDGTKYLYFRLEDNAGNIIGESSEYSKTEYKIDTTAPIDLKVYKTSKDGTPLTGDDVVPKSAATYYLEATGEGVGVQGFSFGNTKAVLEEGEKRYKITIPADSVITGDAHFTVTDLLGNSATYVPFRFKVDESKPSITIDTPRADSKLNGTITITGSVSDSLTATSRNDGKVVKIELSYSIDGGQTYKTINSQDTKEDLKNSNESFSISHKFSTISQMLAASGDKLALTDDSAKETLPIILKVVATDHAGNKGEATRSFVIDRNTDRPVISFTTVELTNSMAKDSEAWLKTTTELVGTVTDDDGITDGNTNMFISTDGSAWKSVAVTNGGWKFDLKTLTDGDEDKANKAHELYFKVIDGENNEFVSKTSSDLKSVILKGNDGNEYGNSTHKDSILFLKVDTKNPEVNITNFDNTALGGTKKEFTIVFTAKDGNGIKEVTGTAQFDFDKDKKYSVIADISDPNFDSNTKTYTYSAKFVIDLNNKHKNADGKDGVLSIRISAVDNADNESFQTRSLNFDYKKPEIKVLKPSTTAASSGSVNAYGTLSEPVKKLEYAISTSKEKKPGEAVTSWTGKNPDTDNPDGGTITSYTPQYTELDASLTWFLYMDGESGDGHISTLKNFIIDHGITTADRIASQGTDKFISIVDIYLWLKAEDENGNTTEICSRIPFDPQGERPTLTISAPENNETVGSTVSVYGVAEPKVGHTIKNVWLQIVSNYHGTTTGNYGTATVENFSITADDLNYLKTNGYNVRKWKSGDDYDTEWNGSGTPSDYAVKIPVNGSTAWSTTINNKGEFNNSENTVNVVLRAFAEDEAGNTSAKETRLAIFDANSPIITAIYYRQKNNDSDTTYASSKTYTNTTYISGQWYLTVTAKDEGEIKELYICEKGDNNKITTNVTVTGTSESKERTLTFKLPNKATDYVGEQSYVITAYDGETRTNKEVIVNYDNKKPDVSALNDKYKTVKQQNGFYKISSQAKEDSVGAVNQSGVHFVAFYFKRGNEVFDTMWYQKNSLDVTSNTIADDGLYWNTLQIDTDKTTQNSITLEAANKNVHTGGLIKIGNVVYVISSVDNESNAKVITFSERIDTSVVGSTVKFALATVVNNTFQEAGGNGEKYKAVGDKENYGYGYYKDPEIDDGDNVIEYLSSDGTWEAAINSLNIPDGAIEINYVVYDKAGNFQHAKVDANVSNNAPRLAGVVIKTDYNGDGSFTGDGEIIEKYNASNNTESAKSITSELTKSSKKYNVYDPDPNRTGLNATWKELSNEPMVIGSETAGALIMKGKTEIHPEIVGGTGAIKYSYVDSKKDGATGLEGNNTTAIISTGTDDYTINTLDHPIVIQVGDLIKAGEWEKSSPDKITFTFTDNANQSANLELYAGINIVPETPEVTINPFHWTNFADNSIYGSNSDTTLETLQGHIELEEHWKLSDGYLKDSSGNTKATKDTSGEYDDDPKVSGKIVITGTARDKVRINKLYFRLPGMETELGTGDGKAGLTAVPIGSESYFCLAEVPSGESVISPKSFWSKTTKDENGKDVVTETNGVKLEFTKNEYSETGHYIEWKLSWNTSKISTVAANDVEVKVIAENCGTPTFATNGTNDDIGLDGTTKYSYGVKDNSVGQNTPSSNQTTKTTKTARYRMDIVPYITSLTTSLATDAKHPSIHSRTALGKYPVYYYTKNPAGETNKGEKYIINGFNLTTTEQTTGKTSGKVELTVNTNVKTLNNVNYNGARYNQQPNSVNNNWLTDDVETVVWNINSQAATSSKGALTETKMHVKPYVDNSNPGGSLGYSYIYKGAMYFNLNGSESGEATSTYNTVDFIYDRNGKAFGTYAGTNFQSTTDAGHLKLASEWWGTPDKDGEHNTTIALESMTYNNKSTPNRFGTPKLATSTSQDALYMLYYDTVTGKFKYRSGDTYSKTKNSPSFTNGNYSGLTGTTVQNENGAKEVSIDSTNAGKYYSIAVAKKIKADGTTENADVVVLVWVDGKTNDLWYSYTEDPLNVSDTNAPTWKTPVKIVSGIADGVCAIAVDPSNHIHIAAYTTDATGSLMYAYLNAYNSLGNDTTWPAANKVYVDRYGTTGEFLTLEFAKRSSSGRYVPFIGYYSNEMPKYAYLVDEAGNNNTTGASWVPKPGVSGSTGTGNGNYYTGAWEEIIVPTSSPVLANDKNNNINIAVYRGSTGVLGNITNGPAGNQCANPVLGYGINYAGKGYVETAQIK